MHEKTPFHPQCAVCSVRNLFGWDLDFRAEGEGVCAEVFLSSHCRGYADRVHGGILATLLDAAMTHCLYHEKVEAVTGDLKIRYHHPVPVDSELHLRARVKDSAPPLYYVESEILARDRVLVSAQARFVEPD
jgi:acyl-coenzyme A thioesterase PaaI-like protein